MISGERKGSRSQGTSNCARVGHAERKPTRSNPSGSCAQVGEIPALISIRNDNDTGAVPADKLGPVYFTPAEWLAFIESVKLGEFDLSEDGRLPALV